MWRSFSHASSGPYTFCQLIVPYMLSDKIKSKSALKAWTFIHVSDKVHACYWYRLSTENSAGYLQHVQIKPFIGECTFVQTRLSLCRICCKYQNIMKLCSSTYFNGASSHMNDLWYFSEIFLFVSPAKQGWHIGIMTQSSSLSAGSHFLFPIDNSWRNSSISFKLYRRVNVHKIQVKLDKGGGGVTRKILTELWPFFT